MAKIFNGKSLIVIMLTERLLWVIDS